ncbi:hypothetical protein [Limisalsivibrio acetivorans]|uniref:hypothetical protein n=1 Tax=Limisalsivibrio acetivorans TaxID=1304888 RepID=UPI0003B36CEA|nr:hypothetical protein [Limisalsivibrio acetivorans]
MEERSVYIEKLEAKLRELEAEIDKLKAKGEGKSADAKIEFEQAMGRLEAKRDEMRIKLEDLNKSTSSAWEELKVGTEQAWNDLKNAVANAYEKYK